MRKPLLVFLGLELLVAVALGQVGHVDRPAAARAFFEWQQNPTPETRRVYERQRGIMEIYRWRFSGVVFAVLAGATVLVYRIRRGEPAASGDAGQRAQQIPGSGFRRT
jgi:hypothetical protein